METIFDLKTNLEWLVEDFEPVTWKEAIELANSKGNGWRIPLVEEMLSIIDRGNQEPIYDSAHQLDYDNYWLDSKYDCNGSNAWRIDSSNGNIHYSDKNNYFYVHYVRSISKISP